MKTIHLITAGVLLFSILALQPATGAEPIGKIVSLTGSATAIAEDGTSRALELNSPVYMNDRITTPEKSKLQIMLDDDSVISQGEKSDITIDQYTYSPEDTRKSSCSARIAKGMFRVVTGKITELNPKRFTVSTRMATIGIRGCDLGFKVFEETEDIFILNLPEGKTIVVQKREDGNDLNGMLSGGNTMYIVEGGVAVAVAKGLDLVERTFDASEVAGFYDLSIPDLSGGSSGLDDDLGAGNDLSSGNGGQAAGDSGDNLAVLTTKAKQTSSSQIAKSEYDELEFVNRPENRPSIDTGPTEEAPTTDPAQIRPPTTIPSTTPPPVTLPPALVASGGGASTDWIWGIYDDGTMQAGKSFASSLTVLNDNQFGLIADDTLTHTLNGVGTSGAFVKQGTATAVLNGPCNIGITIGQSVTPTWNGNFNLTDAAGDALVFQAGGNIIAGGLLIGSPSGYSLLVNSTPYPASSLTAQRIEGSLIGDGTLTVPSITAVSGQFAFQHGSAVRVDGVYGATMTEAAF